MRIPRLVLLASGFAALGAAHAAPLGTVSAADLSVTKQTARLSVFPGGRLSYVVVVTNPGPDAASDVVLTDVLPANLRFVALLAPAGWTVTTPPLDSSGTVTASTSSLAAGASAGFTLNVDATADAAGTITNTATIAAATPDPQASNNASTSSVVVVTTATPASVTGTKAFAGDRTPGGTVAYAIVLRNGSTGPQLDNPGDEFVDVLPPSLLLLGATASSGTIVATPATNTVTWNGSIETDASVTITATATIAAGAPAGTTIANQGTIATDLDGNRTNETTRLTDDPSTGAAADATAFAVVSATPLPVPLVNRLALVVLGLAIAVATWRRRRIAA